MPVDESDKRDAKIRRQVVTTLDPASGVYSVQTRNHPNRSAEKASSRRPSYTARPPWAHYFTVR